MDESNIPIDINIGKLQDWLVSRRHVNKEWQKSIKTVREKINNAIQDMPVHEGIAELLAGSHINYFHCLKIVEILRETEADSKNIFGMYGSQRMKDWQDIIKLYEKDNLYLAEAAQILVRNIQYEIPSTKKQINKQEQLQTEAEKKAADYLKSEAATKSEFLTTCKQLGITGDNIKRELVQRLDELPDMYEKVALSLKPVLPAINLYSIFHKYHMNMDAEVLPILKYVAMHGNTTVYEWTYGEPPLNIEPDPIRIQFDDEQDVRVEENQIDFGDAGASGIDFGSIDEPSEIDFGESASGEIDWGNIEDTSTDVTGDFSLAEISLAESGIVVEADGLSGGTARGSEALTILDNTRTNSLLLRQLDELESFLKMRVYETSQINDSGVFGLMQDLPVETVESLAAMLDAVRAAITNTNDTKLTHLHNVKHSPRYVDVLTSQLKQKLTLCQKLKKMSARAKERALEARRDEENLRPLLARLISKTTDLQKQIEKDVSKKYKNRPVNIIGGVNFL